MGGDGQGWAGMGRDEDSPTMGWIPPLETQDRGLVGLSPAGVGGLG